MTDRAHGQGVIADDPLPATQDVGGCCTCRGRGSRGLAQPLVERSNSAVELVHVVSVVKELDLTQRRAAQRSGIGLGSPA